METSKWFKVYQSILDIHHWLVYISIKHYSKIGIDHQHWFIATQQKIETPTPIKKWWQVTKYWNHMLQVDLHVKCWPVFPFFQTLRDKEQNSMDWWENLNRKPWFSPSNGNSGFNFPIIQFEKWAPRPIFMKRPSSAPHQRVPETHDFIRLAGSSTDGEGDLKRVPLTKGPGPPETWVKITYEKWIYPTKIRGSSNNIYIEATYERQVALVH